MSHTFLSDAHLERYRRYVGDVLNKAAPSGPVRPTPEQLSEAFYLTLRSSFASAVSKVYLVSAFVALLALIASLAMPGKRLESNVGCQS